MVSRINQEKRGRARSSRRETNKARETDERREGTRETQRDTAPACTCVSSRGRLIRNVYTHEHSTYILFVRETHASCTTHGQGAHQYVRDALQIVSSTLLYAEMVVDAGGTNGGREVELVGG